MKKNRISKDKYYWKIAKEIAQRGTCLSTKFGAVIVNNDEIVSTGYNGAPRKTKSCDERGYCLRRKEGISSGTQYERCASVHAEQNAMIQSSRKNMIGGIMYLYGAKVTNDKEELINAFPCFICKKMIINTGIEKLVANDSKGNLKVYNIEEWIKEWQEKHLLEDTEKYKTEY